MVCFRNITQKKQNDSGSNMQQIIAFRFLTEHNFIFMNIVMTDAYISN